MFTIFVAGLAFHAGFRCREKFGTYAAMRERALAWWRTV